MDVDQLEVKLKNFQVLVDKQNAFQVYQDVQTLSGITKEPKDIYLIKVMNISKDVIDDYLMKQEQIQSTSKRQKELKHFLDEAAKFPNKGFGNFSNKYREFCEELKRNGFIDSFDPYEWSTEPTLLEKIFHKINDIPILSKEDKKKIRYQRIQEILETIEELRRIANISTDLFLESDKCSFKIFIDGKLSILSDKREFIRVEAIENSKLSPKDAKISTESLFEAIKKTWSIDNELSHFKSQVSSIHEARQLVDLKNQFDKTIREISGRLENILDEVSLPDVFFQQEFMNKTRFEKRQLVTRVFDLEKIKKDYRLDVSSVTKSLIEELKHNKEKIAAYEFFIASTYECLKEIKDYPEIQGLESTDQIRNYFFHVDVSDHKISPLVVHRKGQIDGHIYSHRPGIVAKEVSILAINIKAILEDLAGTL